MFDTVKKTFYTVFDTVNELLGGNLSTTRSTKSEPTEVKISKTIRAAKYGDVDNFNHNLKYLTDNDKRKVLNSIQYQLLSKDKGKNKYLTDVSVYNVYKTLSSSDDPMFRKFTEFKTPNLEKSIQKGQKIQTTLDLVDLGLTVASIGSFGLGLLMKDAGKKGLMYLLSDIASSGSILTSVIGGSQQGKSLVETTIGDPTAVIGGILTTTSTVQSLKYIKQSTDKMVADPTMVIHKISLGSVSRPYPDFSVNKVVEDLITASNFSKTSKLSTINQEISNVLVTKSGGTDLATLIKASDEEMVDFIQVQSVIGNYTDKIFDKLFKNKKQYDLKLVEEYMDKVSKVDKPTEIKIGNDVIPVTEEDIETVNNFIKISLGNGISYILSRLKSDSNLVKVTFKSGDKEIGTVSKKHGEIVVNYLDEESTSKLPSLVEDILQHGVHDDIEVIITDRIKGPHSTKLQRIHIPTRLESLTTVDMDTIVVRNVDGSTKYYSSSISVPDFKGSKFIQEYITRKAISSKYLREENEFPFLSEDGDVYRFSNFTIPVEIKKSDVTSNFKTVVEKVISDPNITPKEGINKVLSEVINDTVKKDIEDSLQLLLDNRKVTKDGIVYLTSKNFDIRKEGDNIVVFVKRTTTNTPSLEKFIVTTKELLSTIVTNKSLLNKVIADGQLSKLSTVDNNIILEDEYEKSKNLFKYLVQVYHLPYLTASSYLTTLHSALKEASNIIGIDNLPAPTRALIRILDDRYNTDNLTSVVRQLGRLLTLFKPQISLSNLISGTILLKQVFPEIKITTLPTVHDLKLNFKQEFTRSIHGQGIYQSYPTSINNPIVQAISFHSMLPNSYLRSVVSKNLQSLDITDKEKLSKRLSFILTGDEGNYEQYLKYLSSPTQIDFVADLIVDLITGGNPTNVIRSFVASEGKLGETFSSMLFNYVKLTNPWFYQSVVPLSNVIQWYRYKPGEYIGTTLGLSVLSGLLLYEQGVPLLAPIESLRNLIVGPLSVLAFATNTDDKIKEDKYLSIIFNSDSPVRDLVLSLTVKDQKLIDEITYSFGNFLLTSPISDNTVQKYLGIGLNVITGLSDYGIVSKSAGQISVSIEPVAIEVLKNIFSVNKFDDTDENKRLNYMVQYVQSALPFIKTIRDELVGSMVLDNHIPSNLQKIAENVGTTDNELISTIGKFLLAGMVIDSYVGGGILNKAYNYVSDIVDNQYGSKQRSYIPFGEEQQTINNVTLKEPEDFSKLNFVLNKVRNTDKKLYDDIMSTVLDEAKKRFKNSTVKQVIKSGNPETIQKEVDKIGGYLLLLQMNKQYYKQRDIDAYIQKLQTLLKIYNEYGNKLYGFDIKPSFYKFTGVLDEYKRNN